jgi:hypothetical protein
MKIIKQVLLIERSPPSSIHEASKNGSESTVTGKIPLRSSKYGIQKVHFETTHTEVNAAGLLGSYRLLREQTIAVFWRLYKGVIRYKLDVLIINNEEFWPTWLHVPLFTRRVHVVDVTFRNVMDNLQGDPMIPFLTVDGAPPPIMWCFHFLLEWFMARGSRSTGTALLNDINDGMRVMTPSLSGQRESRWAIESVLKIDFSFEAGPGLNRPTAPASLIDVRHPGWIAHFVAAYLRGLLRDVQVKYVRGMIPRIGQVHFSAPSHKGDYQITTLINLGEHLGLMEAGEDDADDFASHSFRGSIFYCELITFWNWKFQAVRHRQKLGLSMPDNVLWPSIDRFKSWRRYAEKYKKVVAAAGLDNLCEAGSCLCHKHELEDLLQRLEDLIEKRNDLLASQEGLSEEQEYWERRIEYLQTMPRYNTERKYQLLEAKRQSVVDQEEKVDLELANLDHQLEDLGRRLLIFGHRERY